MMLPQTSLSCRHTSISMQSLKSSYFAFFLLQLSFCSSLLYVACCMFSLTSTHNVLALDTSLFSKLKMFIILLPFMMFSFYTVVELNTKRSLKNKPSKRLKCCTKTQPLRKVTLLWTCSLLLHRVINS